MGQDLNEVYSALKAADAAGDHESAQKLSDYIRAQDTTPATPKQPEAKQPLVEKVFGKEISKGATFEERLQRINKAGLTAAEFGGGIGATAGIPAGPAGVATGAVGGAAAGYVAGAGAEVVEQGLAAANTSRATQVMGGLLFGGSLPTAIETVGKSILGKATSMFGKTAAEVMTPSVDAQKAIAKGKQSQLKVEKPITASTPTFEPVNTKATQEALAQEKGITPLSKDELKAAGIEVGTRQPKISDTERLNLFKDMSDFTSKGISPIKQVKVQEKGVPSATGKPTGREVIKTELDPAMEKRLVEFGKATPNELGILKKVFRDQASKDSELRNKANADLLNLIQHGDFVTTTSKGMEAERALSPSTQKALQEAYGEFLKKNGREGAYTSLVDTWHREFMADARDAIPQVFKSGFKLTEKFGADRTRSMESVLKNIGEDPAARAELRSAFNQHLSSLNEKAASTGSIFGGKPKTVQKEFNTQGVLDEVARLRPALEKAKVMSSRELDALEASIKKIPTSIERQKAVMMATTIAKRALTTASSQAYETSKDNK